MLSTLRHTDPSTYLPQPRTIFITGGCGFIGSNYVNYHYAHYPADVIINLDDLYYCANEANVLPQIRADTSRYHFIKGNLCSMDLLRHILTSYSVSHVIHFAAQSHVQNSFDNALQYTHDNIVGTHTLLEACRKYGRIQRFIHVSTDEVYGESMLVETEQKKHENSVLCPTNPYAATKAGAELIAQSYYHSFNMPIIITRGNNVYGPRQYPEKLIPRFIDLLSHDQPVTIQGNGSNVRGFLHVDDVCAAFDVVLSKGEVGEIYNIGCDEKDEYTVWQIACMLIHRLKYPDLEECPSVEVLQNWITYIEDRPFNDKRYYISNQKVKDLGWQIQVPFVNGLDDLCK